MTIAVLKRFFPSETSTRAKFSSRFDEQPCSLRARVDNGGMSSNENEPKSEAEATAPGAASDLPESPSILLEDGAAPPVREATSEQDNDASEAAEDTSEAADDKEAAEDDDPDTSDASDDDEAAEDDDEATDDASGATEDASEAADDKEAAEADTSEPAASPGGSSARNDDPFARSNKAPMDPTSFLPPAIVVLLLFFGFWQWCVDDHEQTNEDDSAAEEVVAPTSTQVEPSPSDPPEEAAVETAQPNDEPAVEQEKQDATKTEPPGSLPPGDAPADALNVQSPIAEESQSLPASPDGGQRGSETAEQALNSSRAAETRGDFRSALTSADAALAAAPGLARYEVQRARILLAQGRLEAALEQVNSAVQHEPMLADAYALRAKVYEGLGNSREAGFNQRAAQAITDKSLLTRPPGRN